MNTNRSDTMEQKLKLSWVDRAIVVVGIVLVAGGMAEVTRGLLAIAYVMEHGFMPA